LSEVAGIQVNQGILTRLLNIGDLVIQSETGERKQFVIMAIPNPNQVATQINNKRPSALDLEIVHGSPGD
jgi:hypothetical protein